MLINIKSEIRIRIKSFWVRHRDNIMIFTVCHWVSCLEYEGCLGEGELWVPLAPAAVCCLLHPLVWPRLRGEHGPVVLRLQQK